MRIFYVVVISVLFGTIFYTSCQKQQRSGVEKKSNNDSANESTSIDDGLSELFLNVESVKIHGTSFDAFMTSIGVFYLLRNATDTLIVDSTLSQDFVFDDFNDDGLPDLRVYFMNNIEVQYLYLYDSSRRSFRFVEGFIDFPDPIRVRNSKYYYSYHRSGCADQDWDSDLFLIRNYKAVRLGNIAGRGCGEGEGLGVFISKVVDGRKIPFEKPPISELSKYEELKWGFIANYWNRRYQLFTK